MWMANRRAGLFPEILEHENVPEPRITQQIGYANLVRLNHATDGLDGLLFELQGRVWRFDDDLVRADAVHLVVHPLPFLVEVALDAQGGKFVRYHPYLPAGLVRFALRVAKRENLRRRHVLVALGKRILGRLGHVHLHRHKIARTLRAVRGNDDPTSYNRILTQFWHIEWSPHCSRRFTRLWRRRRRPGFQPAPCTFAHPNGCGYD